MVKAILAAILILPSLAFAEVEPITGPDGTKAPLESPTFTGRITAPDATLTYGLNAATASFSGLISGAGSLDMTGAAGVRASSFTATYGLNASTAVITHVQASSITTTGGITAYGNVGVGGLPNATYKLQIGENTSSAGNPPLQQSLGGTYNGTVAGDATKSKLMVYYDGTSASGLGISSFGGRTQFEYASDFDHAFYGADTERMRLKTGGNLGIGTADPASKLHMSSGTLTIDGNTQLAVNIGGTFKPWSRTKAQVDTLAAGTVGEYIHVTDTTLPGLCVSTGTAAAQWRKIESATLGCGTNN